MAHTTEYEITRTARKQHTCERTRHTGVLVQAGIDWRENPDLYGFPCNRGDEPIRIGETYIEDEGDDEFHPSRYHVECFDPGAVRVPRAFADAVVEDPYR